MSQTNNERTSTVTPAEHTRRCERRPSSRRSRSAGRRRSCTQQTPPSHARRERKASANARSLCISSTRGGHVRGTRQPKRTRERGRRSRQRRGADVWSTHRLRARDLTVANTAVHVEDRGTTRAGFQVCANSKRRRSFTCGERPSSPNLLKRDGSKHAFTHKDDPQPGVVQEQYPRTAMCVRNVDVHVSCSSHADAQLAAFFIDPRAK